MNVTEQLAKDLVRRLVLDQANILTTSLDGNLIDRNRMVRVITPDGNETYTYDNQPLVTFHPVEFYQEGNKLGYRQNYQLHVPTEKD